MDTRVGRLELKVLYDINKMIGQALNLDQAMEIILGILSESLATKRAAIYLTNGDKKQLKLRATHGLRAEEKKSGVCHFIENKVEKIFQNLQPFIVPELSKEMLFLDKLQDKNVMEKKRISFIGMPIVLHGSPVGVLSVDRLFGEKISLKEDVRVLQGLSGLISQFLSLNDQVQAREDHLIRATASLKTELRKKSLNFFSCRSPAIQEVQQLIRKVAPTKATVLLHGETGVGKTLAARIIHELSSRSALPFVKISGAAIPEKQMEAQIFGCEKANADSSANSKGGKVEEADGGTIFFDEIADMPMPLQAKLLRFIQEMEFERVGSTATRKADVRIIAATKRDLASNVANGYFRQDLFYRLNVFPIKIPSLRERSNDIDALITYFTQAASKDCGCELRFSPVAEDLLRKYSWPGNVKELENLIERLAIFAEDKYVDINDLTPYISQCFDELPDELQTLDSLKEMERRGVVAALERNKWIQSRAARELGITMRQMGYRIRKYGLEEYVRQKRALS